MELKINELKDKDNSNIDLAKDDWKKFLYSLEKILSKPANNLKRYFKAPDNLELLSTELQRLDEKLDDLQEQTDLHNTISSARQQIIQLQQLRNHKFATHATIRSYINSFILFPDARPELETAKQLQSAAPDYWLGSIFLALLAWSEQEQELAEQAVKNAVRLAPDKASLFLSLYQEQRADYWLEQYLSTQELQQIDNSVVILLDAFASGLFSHTVGTLTNTISSWRETIANSDPTLWTIALQNGLDPDNSELPDISCYSHLEDSVADWDELEQALQWSLNLEKIKDKLTTITTQADTAVDSVVSKAEKKKAVISAFISGNAALAAEELELMRQIRWNQLIILATDSDLVGVETLQQLQAPRFAAQQSFAFWLYVIIIDTTDFKIVPETKKLALTLSKDLIIAAHQQLTDKYSQRLAAQQTLTIANWTKTTDCIFSSSVTSDLRAKIKEEEKQKSESGSKIDFINAGFIIVFFFLTIFVAKFIVGNSFVAFILTIPLAIIYICYREWRDSKKITEKYAKIEEERLNILESCCDEYAQLSQIYQKHNTISKVITAILQRSDLQDNLVRSNLDKLTGTRQLAEMGRLDNYSLGQQESVLGQISDAIGQADLDSPVAATESATTSPVATENSDTDKTLTQTKTPLTNIETTSDYNFDFLAGIPGLGQSGITDL